MHLITNKNNNKKSNQEFRIIEIDTREAQKQLLVKRTKS